MSIQFDSILDDFSSIDQNQIHLNSEKSDISLNISGKVIKIPAYRLQELKDLCAECTLPLTVNLNASQIAGTEPTSCYAQLTHINNQSHAIRDENAERMARYESWKRYDEAQIKIAELTDQLVASSAQCATGYAHKEQIISALQRSIKFKESDITSHEYQLCMLDESYNPNLMKTLELFVTHYRAYEMETDNYLAKKQRYNRALAAYNAWHTADAKALREKQHAQDNCEMESIRSDLTTLDAKISSDYAKSNTQTTAIARSLLNDKNKRAKLEKRLKDLERKTPENAPCLPTEPIAPSQPTLPEGAIRVFGNMAINMIIAEFNRRKVEYNKHKDALERKITNIRLSISENQRLSQSLSCLMPVGDGPINMSHFTFDDSTPVNAAKALLDMFEKHDELSKSIMPHRAVQQPAAPKPENYPAQPSLIPLPKYTIELSSLVLHFNKQACMKVAQKMHNPWSLQEKRGYTQRIITALCFLALGNHILQYAWNKLWLWAIFTMYNPATWVMAINVSMSLIAVTGLFLFGYQLYRASIQSTADFICSRVKNLAYDHATNPSSIQAHVGWFGFSFFIRWQWFTCQSTRQSDQMPTTSLETTPTNTDHHRLNENRQEPANRFVELQPSSQTI